MEKTNKRSISGKTLLVPFGVVLLMTAAINLIVGVRMADAYNKLEATTDNHMAFHAAYEQFNLGSDILTSSVRQYVVTGDTKHIDSYFQEAKVTKNRDEAIKSIEEFGYSDETTPLINEAKSFSDGLMVLEYHAMKLASVGFGSDVSQYPEIYSYTLSEEELAYTTDQAKLQASNLVNNENYNEIKNKIYAKTEAVFDLVSEKNEVIHRALQNKMKTYVTVEIVSTSLFTFLLLLAIFILGHSILFPMANAQKAVDEDKLMDDTYGLSEYTALAGAYNNLLRRRDTLENELRNIANTDPLTGLPNRNAIAGVIESCGDKVFKNIAILSLDVNRLKETNDTKGHKAGDELLCNSADCILDYFGNDSRNNCCRIGGDEFTAFLVGFEESDVIAKIETFNRAQVRYGVSISVGYSFRKSGNILDMKSMYEEADKRMYKAKAEAYRINGWTRDGSSDSKKYD